MQYTPDILRSATIMYHIGPMKFHNVEEAEQQLVKLQTAAAVYETLPNYDGYRQNPQFLQGLGYFQHSAEKIAAFNLACFNLFKQQIDPSMLGPDKGVDPVTKKPRIRDTIVLETMVDNLQYMLQACQHNIAEPVFYRLCCIDSAGREWLSPNIARSTRGNNIKLLVGN